VKPACSRSSYLPLDHRLLDVSHFLACDVLAGGNSVGNSNMSYYAFQEKADLGEQWQWVN
jgi:hypothetical protein